MSDVVIKLSAIDAASGVLERVAQNVRGVGKAADAQRGAFGALEQVAVGALRQIGAAAVNLAGFSALQRAEIAEIPTSAPCPTRVPDPDTCTSSLLSLPGVSSQHSYLSMDGRVSQLDFCARTASSCETRCFPFQ